MNIPNKQEFQKIATNHSSGIDFDGFIRLYRKCTANKYLFSVIDTTLSSDNLLRFRNNSL